jgi:c-di-GMP phosphodiesterase
MEPFYLARQPIYDRNLRVAAYELLFRGTPTEDARILDGDLATSAVFSRSVLDIGLERLVGNHAAFINATRAFLSGEQALPDLHERVVLEVLENIDPDPELVAQLKTLKRAGYRIALDDFVYRPALQPLLALADYVKLDVLALAPAELAQHV